MTVSGGRGVGARGSGAWGEGRSDRGPVGGTSGGENPNGAQVPPY